MLSHALLELIELKPNILSAIAMHLRQLQIPVELTIKRISRLLLLKRFLAPLTLRFALRHFQL
jgi:hypothetical protein